MRAAIVKSRAATSSVGRTRPVTATRAHGRGVNLAPIGEQRPRLAPPKPKRTLVKELLSAADVCSLELMPWQQVAGEYMTALDKERWAYREVCIVVARQNGKSAMLVPRIVMALLRGERVMHTAQNRELPRAVYHDVAAIMETRFPLLLKHKPRYANGQELIQMTNGGHYRIVAPNTAGARGYTNDLVIIDELREMTDFDFVAAARPTLTASRNPQVLYLSNAGDEASVVLNALRKRADSDTELAYLEWSAQPDRMSDDVTAWAEANPSLGRLVDITTLQTAHRQLPAPVFETEHLCRWVSTMLPRMVAEVTWSRAKADLEVKSWPALRASMGIAVDPQGRRASAVVAWKSDGVLYLHLLADFTGEPIDLDAVADGVLGEPGLLDMQKRMGIRQVAYDPWTDRDLARYFKEPRPIQTADYESACEGFVRALEGGRLRHSGEVGLSADMAWTVRRDTSHGWIAVRASDERATTASLAAIRASWLATMPAPSAPKVY